jgi:hypothetical protein
MKAHTPEERLARAVEAVRSHPLYLRLVDEDMSWAREAGIEYETSLPIFVRQDEYAIAEFARFATTPEEKALSAEATEAWESVHGPPEPSGMIYLDHPEW